MHRMNAIATPKPAPDPGLGAFAKQFRARTGLRRMGKLDRTFYPLLDMSNLRLAYYVFALFLLFPATAVVAQGYPNKPIRIVVPYPPGGGADNVTRVYAQKLTQVLGKQVVVDNRGGAAAVIGAEIVAKSPADGYTLLHDAFSHGGNPALRKLPYDTLKDFAPVTLVVVNPLLLLVHPAMPIRTLQDLIRLAKARPGEITYASSGIGTAQHLAGELLRYIAKVNIVHVPYKGGAPAIADLMGGHVLMQLANTATGLVYAKTGKLKGIAVTSAKRSLSAPEYPTFVESGVSGIEVYEWNGLFAPAGTPREIIATLNTEVIKILNLPEVNERLLQLGGEVRTSTPDELGEYVRREVAKWTKLVKDVGIKSE